MAFAEPALGREKMEVDSVLKNATRALSDGLALKNWLDRSLGTSQCTEFDLVETFNRPDRSRGFFGRAPLEGRTLPVMGVVDELFYDRPKAVPGGEKEAARWMKEQIRQFVLKYFLRISDTRRPQTVVETPEGFLADLLGPLSPAAKPEVEKDGMGFTQAYFQKKGSTNFEAFDEEGQSEIIDLRELGRVYDSIVLRLSIYQFNVSLRPMGATAPQFMVPLKEESYLVVSPEFIRDVENPEPGVLGEYGFGYAFLRNPRRGPFAYGPGEFGVAFQTINFRVLDTGEVWVKMTFASDQPQKIVNLTLDPVEWGFTMADAVSFGQASQVLAPFKRLLQQMPFRDFNLDPTVTALDWMNTLTAGQVAQQLSISKEDLYRGFLRRHSLQHYQTVLGSLRIWRMIPNWLDEMDLPVWVVKGWSS